uniref:Uncharacterized protein n=1 Tax=Cajanus cajan TaxID=3821 RepID=A0A151T9U4_CAJCA|nr:hypothetical protein KK1_018356 [Cajanus cajan]
MEPPPMRLLLNELAGGDMEKKEQGGGVLWNYALHKPREETKDKIVKYREYFDRLKREDFVWQPYLELLPTLPPYCFEDSQVWRSCHAMLVPLTEPPTGTYYPTTLTPDVDVTQYVYGNAQDTSVGFDTPATFGATNFPASASMGYVPSMSGGSMFQFTPSPYIPDMISPSAPLMDYRDYRFGQPSILIGGFFGGGTSSQHSGLGHDLNTSFAVEAGIPEGDGDEVVRRNPDRGARHRQRQCILSPHEQYMRRNE